ncbi:hypothetical protein Hanom_Chr10g00954101 [Helianthus anomalus]
MGKTYLGKQPQNHQLSFVYRWVKQQLTGVYFHRAKLRKNTCWHTVHNVFRFLSPVQR